MAERRLAWRAKQRSAAHLPLCDLCSGVGRRSALLVLPRAAPAQGGPARAAGDGRLGAPGPALALSDKLPKGGELLLEAAGCGLFALEGEVQGAVLERTDARGEGVSSRGTAEPESLCRGGAAGRSNILGERAAQGVAPFLKARRCELLLSQTAEAPDWWERGGPGKTGISFERFFFLLSESVCVRHSLIQNDGCVQAILENAGTL